MYLTTNHRIMIFQQKKVKGKTSNPTTNTTKTLHMVCVPFPPPGCTTLHFQAMEQMAWVLAWRWSEKWYAFIMAVAQFSVCQRRVFFGPPKMVGLTVWSGANVWITKQTWHQQKHFGWMILGVVVFFWELLFFWKIENDVSWANYVMNKPPHEAMVE